MSTAGAVPWSRSRLPWVSAWAPPPSAPARPSPWRRPATARRRTGHEHRPRATPVTGLTVTSGTTPEPFTGKVLGVLQDGIAPDLDMVMVQLVAPTRPRSTVDRVTASGRACPARRSTTRTAPDRRRRLRPVLGSLAGRRRHAVRGHGRLPADRQPAKVQVGDRRGAHHRAALGRHRRRRPTEGFSQLPMPTGVSGVSNRPPQPGGEPPQGPRVAPEEHLPDGCGRDGR